MKFKPLTSNYNFPNDVLTKDFPSFMHDSVSTWIYEILNKVNKLNAGYSFHSAYLKDTFHNDLQLILREQYPQSLQVFLPFIFVDSDRTANFLALCLQNYSDENYAEKLEKILAQSGSGYEVICNDTKTKGIGTYDLAERVDPIIKNTSADALKKNKLLAEAWTFCFARNPDYEKVVLKCQNALEHLLKEKYYPDDVKPQLGKLIANLKKSIPTKLSYKGDTVPLNKDVILHLIDNIATFRGIHTAGTGKIPNKQEAEFILFSSIFVWSLHN